MAKYIDVEELKKELICNKNFYPTIIKNALEKLPSADVVEVVRCKDCKKYADFDIHNGKRLTFHFCNKFSTITTENDYCSFGERRDEK